MTYPAAAPPVSGAAQVKVTAVPFTMAATSSGSPGGIAAPPMPSTTSFDAALAPHALTARTRTTNTPGGAGADTVVVPGGHERGEERAGPERIRHDAVAGHARRHALGPRHRHRAAVHDGVEIGRRLGSRGTAVRPHDQFHFVRGGPHAASRHRANAHVVGAGRHAARIEVACRRPPGKPFAMSLAPGVAPTSMTIEARLGSVQRRAPFDGHLAAVRDGVRIGGRSRTPGHAGARIERQASHRVDFLIVEIGQRLAAGQHALEPRVERVHDAVPARAPGQQVRSGARRRRQHRGQPRPEHRRRPAECAAEEHVRAVAIDRMHGAIGIRLPAGDGGRRGKRQRRHVRARRPRPSVAKLPPA